MQTPKLDEPTTVRRGEELDTTKLAAYLADSLPETSGQLVVEQFPSGFSNLTYCLRWGGKQWVLRRPPFGVEIKSAHDMKREFGILSGLAESYGKAPRPQLYCDDPAVLGAPFYLMERVEGVILRGHMDPSSAPRPESMGAIADNFIETLADLHQVDFRAAGLEDLGKPEGYVERQVNGWCGRYQRSKTDDLAEMEEVSRWLRQHRPVESSPPRAALIHNDFKYDNLVLDPAEGREVIAVLDWEMATLGDPLMDLGTTLGYWVDPDDPPGLVELALSPTTLPGNPPRREVAQRYAAATGQNLDDLVFFYTFGLFKIAVIVQQIYARYRAGHTRDRRFAALLEGVRQCGRTAAQAIHRGRIDSLF